MNTRAHLSAVSLSCLVAIAAACSRPAEQQAPAEEAVSTAADADAIRAVMDQWAVALNAEDTDAMMALLTENTHHLAPNEPALTGQGPVRGWFDAMFAEEGAPVFSIQTDEVRVAGDWAVGRGTYSFTVGAEGAEPMTVPGKWMIIFERGADGNWRAASTIWNLDVPEPASE